MNFYKLTSSVYGERTPTSSHHVYVVYTLLTVHIKCICCANFYTSTSERTPHHQVYMVDERLQVHIKCI